MDYHQILTKLFVGSYPASVDDIRRLKRASGISAVLNLQTDEDIRHFQLDWDLLLSDYQTSGIELRRVSVRDFDPVDLQDKLPHAVLTSDQLLRAGHTLYLHCSAGAGRSPTVAIAYLAWCCGWDLDRAVVHVQQCRPCSPNVDAIRVTGSVFERLKLSR